MTRYLLDTNIISNVIKPLPSESLLAWMSAPAITDAELKRLFAYLDKAEAEGLEHPIILLAIRLQFEFAARKSEILLLQWAWVDIINHRVEWPDSKTGGMSKPIKA